MSDRIVLAVDLGAESGRVMAVHFNGHRLRIKQLHRFLNPVTTVNRTMHWNLLHLWREIQTGIEIGKDLKPASIGIDAWGVDFALLDSKGELIGNPVNYRDSRTEGMMEAVFSKVGKSEVFAQTGIQFMPINTLYQMMSLVEHDSPQLEIAATFLTIPDLLNYWLTNTKVCELSIASTTQMYNPLTLSWAKDLLDRLSIPTDIFPEIVESGTQLGKYENIPVIAPACHDTGSAVAGVPALSSDYGYISSGTWSLVGTEEPRPVINGQALEHNVTNEGGVYGSIRLLKNVMGLWILQQCRASWTAAGKTSEYDELVKLAEESPPLLTLIDPDDSRFLPPGDHPGIIRQICKESGQAVPQDIGEVVRCILESLALKYRRVIETLQTLSGRQLKIINIVGGGSQNRLLNQLTADATGLPVQAGPVEATVLGNGLVQLITLGELSDIHEGRRLISHSFGPETYEPRDKSIWDEAYQRFYKEKSING
jgi:rhamnulokinase